MVVFANVTGFAVAARYGVNLIGVALAGLAGVWIGGWIGTHTIGSYEYTVPSPQADREVRIIAGGQVRVLELKDVPTETAKRIPIGSGPGALVGFVVGAVLYARLARPTDEDPAAGGTPDSPADAEAAGQA